MVLQGKDVFAINAIQCLIWLADCSEFEDQAVKKSYVCSGNLGAARL
jgi:hypothetical protein